MGLASLMCALAASVAPCGADARDASQGYVTRGVAPVVDGNISNARAAALLDAQQKAVLAALTDQLSVAALTGYFLTLKNLFISRPDIYLQRFKIVSENTLLESCTVSIQGFVQQELLRHDLQSIGVLGPEREKLQVLLMVAETPADETTFRYWWAADPATRALPYGVGDKLAVYFRERGVVVLDHNAMTFEVPVPAGDAVLPAREPVLAAARQAGAQIVVLGKARLKNGEDQQLASFAKVQCDMSADVLDVRSRELVLQTATYALGVHIDQESAARDAIDKACGNLAGQILDKIFLKMRNTHQYAFHCTFGGTLSEAAVRGFFEAFRSRLPDIEYMEVSAGEAERTWVASVGSAVDSAALMQKIFEAGIPGYAVKAGAVEDTVINITVSLTEKESR